MLSPLSHENLNYYRLRFFLFPCLLRTFYTALTQVTRIKYIVFQTQYFQIKISPYWTSYITITLIWKIPVRYLAKDLFSPP